MPKKRVSSSKRTPRGSVSEPQVTRFVGVSLSGGKQDKACVAILEYFPKHDKVFLVKLYEKIKGDESVSVDSKILDVINSYENTAYVVMDVPTQLPICLTCELKCPGIEKCQEPHIQWMHKKNNEKNAQKKPKKLFTSYTQRAVEFILSYDLEETFTLPHAMGANSAPLVARALFLAKRVKAKILEANPKVTIWRVGRYLKLQKSHLMFHRHSVGGDESRLALLSALSEHNVVFVYKEDIKSMYLNNHSFEAFICALTGFFKFKGLTEKPPKGFPSDESWIEIPIKNLGI